MSPDDPRHGQRKGYYAHKRDGEEACAACKRAAAAADARYVLNRAAGVQARVPSIGTKRRLHALAAMGYTWTALDRELGTARMAEKWANEPRVYIFATSAARVAAIYERLSMRFPPETNRHEKTAAGRARNLARRQGWPPPLAWDNIDDPNERPRGWEYNGVPRRSRAEILAELDEMGAGITVACQKFRVKREAVEKWCERHNMRDVYERMIRREQPRYVTNQHMERTA